MDNSNDSGLFDTLAQRKMPSQEEASSRPAVLGSKDGFRKRSFKIRGFKTPNVRPGLEGLKFKLPKLSFK